jgi:multidrug transporter EmrE-like cation transporter
VFANLVTAVSVFAGTVFLHEPFSAVGLICCIMVLAGIFGVQLGDRQKK